MHLCKKRDGVHRKFFRVLCRNWYLQDMQDGNPDYDKSEDAFHVSCASYMLSKKYGMDISQFDFTHAPEFLKKWNRRR